MMPGFRSKKPWKSMIAFTYYALSFLGFSGGVYIGVAFLVIAWSLPSFCLAVYEALFRNKKELLYAIPVFIMVLGIGAALVAAGYEVKIKSATAEVAVAGINEAVKQVPETTPDASPAEEKFYITPSGGKYHMYDCRFIEDKQVIPVSVTEAEDRGLTPCGVCLK